VTAGNCTWALPALLALAAGATVAQDHDHRPLVGVHSVDVYVDRGVLHLLHAEYPGTGQGPRLYHRRSVDGAAWSAAVRVDDGILPTRLLHRGNDAQIVANGSRVIAIWHTSGTGQSGSGPMASALSADGGKTWSKGPAPAPGSGKAGQGYLDIAARGGTFHLAWLSDSSARQALYYASSRDGGSSWGRGTRLDEATCECCWNTVLPAVRGPLHVLYRGVDPRDMLLATSVDGGATWRRGVPVGRFEWNVKACPHTGGALAEGVKGVLHALSWTGRQGSTGLYAMATNDGGKSWIRVHRMGGATAQRGDIAARGRMVAAVWDEYIGGEMAVFAAVSADSGATWSAPWRLSATGGHAIHPRVAPVAGVFLALWTEQIGGAPGTLQQGRIPAR
jgi:hypothetical protein